MADKKSRLMERATATVRHPRPDRLLETKATDIGNYGLAKPAVEIDITEKRKAAAPRRGRFQARIRGGKQAPAS